MGGKFFLFQYENDDIVKMRKKLPCGSCEWKVLRVGSQIKLECTGCKRQMEMDRVTIEKATSQVKRGDQIFDRKPS